LEPAFGGALRSKSKHLRQDTFVASIISAAFLMDWWQDLFVWVANF